MRGKSKWSIPLALVFVLSLFLSACSGDGGSDKTGGSGNDGGSDNGQTESKDNNKDNGGEAKYADNQELRIDILTEPPSLDPATAVDTTSATVLKAVFDGLTRLNPNGKAEPAQAKNIDVSDDGLTYTATIRDDAEWSNGDPVTAEDFAYAWKHVLDPKTADTDYAYQLYPIKNAEKAKAGKVSLDKVGVKVLGDKKLKITLEHPTPYFDQLLAFETFYPVDSKVAKKNPKWAANAGPKYVTNGPFLLDTWKHKNEIILKKNPKYWNNKNVHLDKIQFVMINDQNTELNMFKQDKLDWAGMPTGSLPTAAIPTLKQQKKLTIHPIAGTFYLSYNVKKKPFTNKNIRKAFAMALDRDALAKNVLKGGQLPAMALVPPSMWKENKKGYFKDNDVAEAKKYLKKGLKELGMSKGDLNVTLSYNEEGNNGPIMQAIQEMWNKNLGVKVKTDKSEWKVYLDKMSKGNYQVGRMGWLGDFNDAINFLEIFKNLHGNNYTNWHSDKYAKLLDKSYNQTGDERKQTMKKAEKLFIDDMPIAPIYFYTDPYTKKDYVKGVYIDGLGNIDYTWAYIAKH